MLTVIFLAVPLIIYDQFRAADEAQNAVLLRSVREQGHVIGQALVPLLSPSMQPPTCRSSAASSRASPTISPTSSCCSRRPVRPASSTSRRGRRCRRAQLDAERETLKQQGILDKLSTTCDGELPVAVRYRTPSGDDEVVTSVTPLKTPAGCWAW